MARLVAGEIEADDAVTDESAGDLRQRQVLRRWHIPQRRDDDPTLETESLPAGGPGLNGLKPMGSRIVATGRATPATSVTNLDLERRMETSDEWVRTRTGIVPSGTATACSVTRAIAASPATPPCTAASSTQRTRAGSRWSARLPR